MICDICVCCNRLAICNMRQQRGYCCIFLKINFTSTLFINLVATVAFMFIAFHSVLSILNHFKVQQSTWTYEFWCTWQMETHSVCPVMILYSFSWIIFPSTPIDLIPLPPNNIRCKSPRHRPMLPLPPFDPSPPLLIAPRVIRLFIILVAMPLYIHKYNIVD